MRLDKAAESFRSETSLVAAPILSVVGVANLYCVDPMGSICEWEHETNELEPIALDFWALLERELFELHARKVRKMSAQPE